VMPFEIIYNTPKPTIITMGQAPRPVEEPQQATAAAVPVPEPDVKTCELCNAQFHADRIDPLCLECRAGMELAKVMTPLVQPKPNRGRPKKMATDKKLDHESGGPETIRKDDAGEQGAIGTHGENAPAQEKVPESSQEDKANG
jgi:hypothetical protein